MPANVGEHEQLDRVAGLVLLPRCRPANSARGCICVCVCARARVCACVCLYVSKWSIGTVAAVHGGDQGRRHAANGQLLGRESRETMSLLSSFIQ